METNDKQNLPTTTTNASEAELVVVLEEKRQQWGALGARTHNLGIELVNTANKIKESLPMPSDLSQINATEAALKIAKQEANKLIETRKATTNLVNTVFGKLMLPEKDLVEVYIPTIEKKLLELKREKKTVDDLEQAKKDEKVRLKTEAIKYINDYDLLFKQEINKKVAGALEYALGMGNITSEGLGDYLKTVRAVFKPIQFATPVMKAVLKNITFEEFNAIWEEVKDQIKEPVFYVGSDGSLFEMEVNKSFEFYDAALLNKSAALEQSKNMAAKNDEELQKQNASSNVAATMQGMATVNAVLPSEKTRALKQKYELVIDATEKNALLVMAVFVSNIDLVRQYVKADWFKLSVAQMAAALTAVKNADNKVEFTGIKFNLVDKL